MTGSLTVPNVGLGDIQIIFNQFDEGEREKAIKMLKDMQVRGYAILVQLEDGTYTRAVSIDAERGVYIVQIPDVLPVVREVGAEAPPVPAKRGRGRPRKSMPIETSHAVGVARSAGG